MGEGGCPSREEVKMVRTFDSRRFVFSQVGNIGEAALKVKKIL